tara:strand:+ start:352 stop:648 length:297 start_codon:yes stop_codon:yes gene_type:complete
MRKKLVSEINVEKTFLPQTERFKEIIRQTRIKFEVGRIVDNMPDWQVRDCFKNNLSSYYLTCSDKEQLVQENMPYANEAERRDIESVALELYRLESRS